MNETPGGGFEASGSRLRDDTVMECKICWNRYQPEQGDDYWQIEPGTPFSQLPDHWRCPQCDAARQQFLVVV